MRDRCGLMIRPEGGPPTGIFKEPGCAGRSSRCRSAASLRDGLVIATYRFNDTPSLAAAQGRSSPGTAGLLQGFFQVAGGRKSNRETTRKTG
jgi:hypothetical protein